MWTTLALLWLAPHFAVSNEEFDQARLRVDSWSWVFKGEAAAGLTDNVYFTEAGKRTDVPFQGDLFLGGELDRPTFLHHHYVHTPFELYPLNFGQSFLNVDAGADLALKALKEVQAQFAYDFSSASDPAVSASGSRQNHFDHKAAIAADFLSADGEWGVRGAFKGFRTSYEQDYDHLSHTELAIELTARKPVFPETDILLHLRGAVYRYDQAKVQPWQNLNSKWIDMALGYDGTIGRTASIFALLGLQLNIYDGATFIIEPMIETGITERLFGGTEITAGFRTRLDNSSYNNYERNTSLYFQSKYVFFDSFLLLGDGEFTLRYFSGGGPQRVDHFFMLKARVEVPWRHWLTPFLELKSRLNFSDGYGLNTFLSAGEDRYSSYQRFDILVGVKSTY